ncbi:MAG: peptidase C14, partial [Mesorhizobium sp.]
MRLLFALLLMLMSTAAAVAERRVALIIALDDFRLDAKGADVALVYFSGHGVEISGDNRLLPIDADASSLDALEKTSLPLEEVRDSVAATAKVGLIMLD